MTSGILSTIGVLGIVGALGVIGVLGIVGILGNGYAADEQNAVSSPCGVLDALYHVTNAFRPPSN